MTGLVKVNGLVYFCELQLMVEAVPAAAGDPFNIFRGHIAVDDLGTRPGQECIGLCSFEGGMCDWNNVPTDDFDWLLVSG